MDTPSLGRLRLYVSAGLLQEGVKFFQQGSPKRQNATEHPPACLPSNTT
ncbi:hypothetical protein [uncultured Campylobacter sp.]|nr:hypothetical protein [uncultured Campylobacter sp.]